MNHSSLRPFVSCAFVAALVGCSYYPSETVSGTGGTVATGGSAGQAQGGNAQGGGGASQGGNAQGGSGTGGSTTSSGGSGGAAPVDFLSCDDVAPGHGVMKVEVVGDVPAGLSRIAADGYDTKTGGGWYVEYIGAIGSKQVAKDYGVVVPGSFRTEMNWGLAYDDTTKQLGDPSTYNDAVVVGGTYLCQMEVCETASRNSTILWCYGTTELCRTDKNTATGLTGTACKFINGANVEAKVP